MDKMKSMNSSRKILADNIKALIEREPVSVRAWALRHGLEQKAIDRIIKEENAASIDTLDKIAEALGLMTWQLLIADLDIANAPQLAVSETELKLVARSKTLPNASKCLFEQPRVCPRLILSCVSHFCLACKSFLSYDCSMPHIKR